MLKQDQTQGDVDACRYDDQVRYLQLELNDIYNTQNELSRKYRYGQKYYCTEKSTKYFLHSRTFRKNAIKTLVTSTGVHLTDDTALLRETHAFYSKLYHATPHEDAVNTGLLAKFLNKIPGDRMSLKSYNLLDKDFTEQELHSALKEMKLGTSLGSDGMTVSFYIEFWPVIKDLVFNSLQEAWIRGKLSTSQRCGLLKLIPKEGKDLFNVGNWRPITLLNVDYKILTKTFALRLSRILPDLIHSDQKGFIKGRYSGENVMDIYAMIQQAQVDKEEYILLMLDIQKAFDSVSLTYLEEILYAFNFPQSFISWIRILYCEKEVRIVNNGHASAPIFPLNGTAQGCSLSPLLYVLVMESLALNIHQNAAIQGFKLDSYHKKIAMLADDTLLALKANHITFETALCTLKEFAIISNLKVNYTKSVAILLNCKESTLTSLQTVSEISWIKEPTFKYIGTHIETTPRHHHVHQRLHHVLLDIRRILIKRNKPTYSNLGRVLIVKSLVASQLTYSLMLAPSPNKQEIKHIQCICNDYMWNYGLHHIKAEFITQSYQHGGFNMYSLARQDMALKLSWIVWLLKPPDQFWKAQLSHQFRYPLPQVLKANVTFVNFHKLLIPGTLLHPFWESVFKHWCKNNYSPNPYKGASVALNSALKTQSVFMPHIVARYPAYAIETIEDWNEITLDLSYYQRKSLSYTSITNNAPPQWFRPHLPVKKKCTDLILANPVSVRVISRQIALDNKVNPTTVWEKWNTDLQIQSVGIHWKCVTNIVFQFQETCMCSFYLRFINRAYATNIKLKIWGYKPTDLCSFCNTVQETCIHLFWDCEKV